MSLRVLIVSGDPAVRSDLRRLFGMHEDVQVVGEAVDAREAVSEARATRPAVILLDGVPVRAAVDAVRRMLAESPDAKALVISDQDEPSAVREAFGAGASGYFLEGADDADVVTAVRALAAGKSYVDSGLGARVIAADVRRRAGAEGVGVRLTERQREVLRLLALGHTNQEIAEMLVLSVRTVETHRAHVMQKLRISSRAELVRYALKHGLFGFE